MNTFTTDGHDCVPCLKTNLNSFRVYVNVPVVLLREIAVDCDHSLTRQTRSAPPLGAEPDQPNPCPNFE